MRFGSFASGIEAASVAWKPLGMRPAFFSEIDKFCCSLLAQRHDDAPNLGDMNEITTHALRRCRRIDAAIFGTPCQAFSVAGDQEGLRDPRGQLTLRALQLLEYLQPRWFVWENVPGVLSSNGGADLGAVLREVAKLGYGWAYRICDAQYFGVPQRRRRIFLVGYLGDWRRAAAVLFERQGMPGNSPASGKTRQDLTGTLTSRTRGGGGLGTDFECDGGLIPFDTTQITSKLNRSNPQPGDPCHPLASRAHPPAIAGTLCSNKKAAGSATNQDAENGLLIPLVAYQCHGSNVGPMGTLRAGNGNETGGVPFLAFGGNNTQGPISVATACNAKAGSRMDFESETLTFIVQSENSHAMQGTGNAAVARSVERARCLDTTGGYSHHQGGTVVLQRAVRRLTPRECERLQGFPDDYTLVTHRKKPAADGPRYKAIGNSIAIPVLRWIGQRILEVDAIG